MEKREVAPGKDREWVVVILVLEPQVIERSCLKNMNGI